MRRVLALCVGAAALAAFTGAAFAQAGADRNQLTQAFVNACTASPQMASYSEPEPACACSAGIVSALATDRQYTVIGRVAHLGNDQAGMDAAVEALLAEGYTLEEMRTAGELLISTADLMDRTCQSLHR